MAAPELRIIPAICCCSWAEILLKREGWLPAIISFGNFSDNFSINAESTIGRLPYKYTDNPSLSASSHTFKS